MRQAFWKQLKKTQRKHNVANELKAVVCRLLSMSKMAEVGIDIKVFRQSQNFIFMFNRAARQQEAPRATFRNTSTHTSGRLL